MNELFKFLTDKTSKLIKEKQAQLVASISNTVTAVKQAYAEHREAIAAEAKMDQINLNHEVLSGVYQKRVEEALVAKQEALTSGNLFDFYQSSIQDVVINETQKNMLENDMKRDLANAILRKDINKVADVMLEYENRFGSSNAVNKVASQIIENNKLDISFAFSKENENTLGALALDEVKKVINKAKLASEVDQLANGQITKEQYEEKMENINSNGYQVSVTTDPESAIGYDVSILKDGEVVAFGGAGNYEAIDEFVKQQVTQHIAEQQNAEIPVDPQLKNFLNENKEYSVGIAKEGDKYSYDLKKDGETIVTCQFDSLAECQKDCLAELVTDKELAVQHSLLEKAKYHSEQVVACVAEVEKSYLSRKAERDQSKGLDQGKTR